MADEHSTSTPGRSNGTKAAARVLAAVGLPVVLDGEKLERLLGILGEHLLLIGNGKKPSNRVTQREADAVEEALAQLRQLIEGLQDRANPPPRLTPDPRDRHGTSTPLDNWLTPYRFPELGGRPSVHDWPWITRLLAIYEIAFHRAAKASPKGENQKKPHPTLRFVDAALHETRAVNGETPPGPFSADTLRAFLEKAGRSKISNQRQELERLIEISDT